MNARHPFSDPDLAQALLKRLAQAVTRPFTFMEVCGTHTVALFRTGIASLLPEGLTHLSGPGCPVSPTTSEIAGAISLAARSGTPSSPPLATLCACLTQEGRTHPRTPKPKAHT